MIFDTHAHLDDRAFDEDRPALLDALPTQGIRLVMNPGCSLASSRAAVALAAQQDYVYAAVGSHPDAADEETEAAIEALTVEDVNKALRRFCDVSKLTFALAGDLAKAKAAGKDFTQP